MAPSFRSRLGCCSYSQQLSRHGRQSSGRHPGIEVGVVPLWVSGAQGSSTHSDGQLPLSSLPHSILGETSSYWIVLLPTLLWTLPSPTHCEQAGTFRQDRSTGLQVGTLCVCTLVHSQLGHTLLVAPESHFVLYLGFVSACPTPLARASSLPSWATATINFPSTSQPLCSTYWTPPSCLCSHCHPLSSWSLPCLVNSPPRSLFSDSPRWASLRLTPHSMSPLVN